MDRGAWQVIVHGVTKSWTQLTSVLLSQFVSSSSSPSCVYKSVLYIPCSLKTIDAASQTRPFGIILDVHLLYNPFSPYKQYIARLQQ